MTTLSITCHPKIRAIWENLYLVSLPELYLRTEEDMRARGTPTTGDSKLDRAMHNCYSKAYKTINQIFELYRLGVNVYVVNYADTEKIYYAIQAHLSSWVVYIQQGLNLYSTPFEDLLELDRFASVVYDKAKFVFDTTTLDKLKGPMNSLGIDLNPITFMSPAGRPRFTHLYKTSQERLMETSDVDRSLDDRKGYEEDFLRAATKYDFRLKDKKQELKKLPIELRPGNEK